MVCYGKISIPILIKEVIEHDLIIMISSSKLSYLTANLYALISFASTL